MCIRDSTLYACAFGVGVYKSTDNGRTWTLKNNGIAESNPYAWRIVRATDGTLYLIVARSNEGSFLTAFGSGALYKSTDGAEHWTRMNLPAGVNGPNGLALDPRDNRRMYLACLLYTSRTLPICGQPRTPVCPW